MRGLMVAGLVPIAAALHSQLIYEQLQAAPHEPGFFDKNPLQPRSRSPVPRHVAGGGPAAGAYFSKLFSDNTVLQRGPARAALYGLVYGDQGKPTSAGASVNVDLSPAVQGQNQFHATTQKDGSWKVLLPSGNTGGNYTATVSCPTCASGTANQTITNVTFGDVWFCSGQSNMQLPLIHAIDRNWTKRQITENGKYKNIRIFTYPEVAVQDGQVEYVSIDKGSGWVRSDAKDANGNWVLDDFSAHCWYTFSEVSDIIEGSGQLVPFGLIESAWGGTQVQSWTPNVTLDSSCRNLTGGAPPQATYPPGNGALWNGMVLPLINMTIKGATWYQGENNCYECNANCLDDPRNCHNSNTTTCGDILRKQGYPCYLKTMIDSWRSAWSAVGGTTDPEFPFGIQTLASTEGSCGNGAIRQAQTFNELSLPNERHPRVFISQGFDAQDPIGTDNWPFGVRASHYDGIDSPYSMESTDPGFTSPESGSWDGTQFLMGPIHPRVKRIVGRRMALAAAENVYGRKDLISQGPVLKNCSVVGDSIQIFFQEDPLKNDAVHVFPSILGPNYDIDVETRDMYCAPLPNGSTSPFCSSFGGVTPLEVRYTVPVNSSYNTSVWLPTSLRATSTRHINTGCKEKCDPQGLPRGCCTNYTKTDGWNMVTTHIAVPRDLNLPIPHSRLGDYITGVRYAWSANPCCPGILRGSLPCPVNACPIRGFNSTLPANPFYAEIVGGKCRCTAPQSCE
eukprot:Hpha_TRINITY_DN30826_c0_g1::TRINITY_DN30826_c0_g1_i1::g.155682::m.155682/K05970/SIAE; sialate O-acetylesterase